MRTAKIGRPEGFSGMPSAQRSSCHTSKPGVRRQREQVVGRAAFDDGEHLASARARNRDSPFGDGAEVDPHSAASGETEWKNSSTKTSFGWSSTLYRKRSMTSMR